MTVETLSNIVNNSMGKSFKMSLFDLPKIWSIMQEAFQVAGMIQQAQVDGVITEEETQIIAGFVLSRVLFRFGMTLSPAQAGKIVEAAFIIASLFRKKV